MAVKSHAAPRAVQTCKAAKRSPARRRCPVVPSAQGLLDITIALVQRILEMTDSPDCVVVHWYEDPRLRWVRSEPILKAAAHRLTVAITARKVVEQVSGPVGKARTKPTTHG